MAKFFTHYTLSKEEKENLEKTCEMLSTLEKNTTLNSSLHFSLIKSMLRLVLANENNQMTL